MNQAIPSDAAIVAAHSGDTLHVQMFVFAILTLSFVVILFGCYLMGKSAFVEMKMAARLNGLADALCISDDDFELFAKATTLFVPTADFLALTTASPDEKLKAAVDVLKQVKSGGSG